MTVLFPTVGSNILTIYLFVSIYDHIAAGCPRLMTMTSITMPLLGSTGGLIQIFADIIAHKVLPTNEITVVYDESLGKYILHVISEKFNH